MSGFTGFGPETRKFLRGLGRNNDKKWFDAHRADYEQFYLEPAKAFVEAIGPKIQAFAPKVNFEPRVNGSIFRVNRDIRFSKDKTPYKDHIDMWFWQGNRKTALSGFFLRVRDKSMALGVGSHGFQREDLARYRKRVADPRSAKTLISVVGRLQRNGFTIQGSHYKKLPRGFEAEGRAAELLLHNGLSAVVERTLPAEAASNKFVTHCAREWKKLAPLHEWLTKEIRA